MTDYKEHKNGINICTKACDLNTQRGCITFIENKRLKKCIFEKWEWICDWSAQTHQNVILFNKKEN